MAHLTHPEFQFIADFQPPPNARVPQPKHDRNATRYLLALAKALRAENLSHSLYNILVSIGRQQHARGYATTAQISIDLGVSFNAVHIATHNYPDFFISTNAATRRKGEPHHHQLSPEAIRLLAAISKRIKAYENLPSA